MTAAELGRFVREELPHLRDTVKLPLTRQLLDTLDCAMGMLREAKGHLFFFQEFFQEKGEHYLDVDEFLATLGLVLGEPRL